MKGDCSFARHHLLPQSNMESLHPPDEQLQSAMQGKVRFGTATITLGHVFITVKLRGQHHAQQRGTAMESQLLQPKRGRNKTFACHCCWQG